MSYWTQCFSTFFGETFEELPCPARVGVVLLIVLLTPIVLSTLVGLALVGIAVAGRSGPKG